MLNQLGTTLESIRRIAIGCAILANTVGALMIFFLVITMNADVLSRSLFHNPLNGVVELVIFSLVLIVFLQLPDVVRSNRLTRSDGMLILIQSTRPTAGLALATVIDMTAAIFMAMITWIMYPEFLESVETCHFFTPPEFGPPFTGNFLTDFSAAWARCDYFGTPGIFTAPWWPAKLAILFGVFLCSVLFTLNALIGFTRLGVIATGGTQQKKGS